MRGRVLLLLVSLAGGLAGGLAGCERAAPPVADQSIRPAKVFRVSSRADTVRHEFVGRLQAAQTVDVSFEVDGEVVELPVSEGESVERGALIAALDPTNFELAVREAEVQLRFATQDLERKERLVRDSGISEAVVDEARAEAELSEVRLSQARKRLADSRISAPFDALVSRRYVDNHTKVRVGKNIARLLDVKELQVVVSVPEYLIATATPDRVVSLTAEFDFLPGREFPLTFRERSGEANPVAQTYEVSFAMVGPDDVTLLPGMTANVFVELVAQTAEVVVIPATALQSDPDGAFYVWIVEPESGQVSRRPVTVAQPMADGIAIAGGLNDADLLVAAGASQLQEGMRVQVIEPAGPAG